MVNWVIDAALLQKSIPSPIGVGLVAIRIKNARLIRITVPVYYRSEARYVQAVSPVKLKGPSTTKRWSKCES